MVAKKLPEGSCPALLCPDYEEFETMLVRVSHLGLLARRETLIMLHGTKAVLPRVRTMQDTSVALVELDGIERLRHPVDDPTPWTPVGRDEVIVREVEPRRR